MIYLSLLVAVLSFTGPLPALASESTPAVGSAPFDSSTLKRVNVQVSPVSWLVGRSNISADIGITRSVTLGPRFTYAHDAPTRFFETETGKEIGLRLNYFLNKQRYENGAVLKPAIYYSDVKRDAFLNGFLDSYSQYESDGPVYEFLVAYQIHLPQSLNFEFAGGLRNYREKRIDWSGTTRTNLQEARVRRHPLVIELNIGYAFFL